MSDFFIAVGADPMDAGSIDIHDETTYAIMAGTFDLSVPGRIGFVLRVRGATADARIASANALFRLIRSAAQAESIGSSVTFSMRPEGTDYAHYDLTGDMADPERNFRLIDSGKTAFYTMLLNCYEYSRGDAVTVTGDISGTKAGSTAAFLVADVPGHIGALAHLELTDTSASGVINRVRVATIRGDFSAATDYTAWLDAIAKAGATDTTIAGTLNGQAAVRTLTSTSFADIARAVQPAGARQQGRMDGYLRVSGTGTAIGTPGSLTGTVRRLPSSIRQSASDFSGAVAPAWGSATAAGSLLFAAVTGNNTTGSAVTPGATPSTYSLLGFSASAVTRSGSAAADYLGIGMYTSTTPASAGATVSLAVTGESLGTEGGAILEIPNVSAPTQSIHVQSLSPADIPTMTLDGPGMLIAVAGDSDGTVSLSGFTTLVNQLGLTIGYQRVPSATSVRPSVTASTPTGATLLSVYFFPETTPIDTYDLLAGQHQGRVQAIDAAGYRGNATASVAATPTLSDNSIGWSWTAATNATAYALTIWDVSRGRIYEVITTGTTYELETLDGLKEVDALPATSGAVAPPPSIRALVATKNDHAMTPVPEVATDGSGSMTLLRAFTNRMLPPVASPIADTWPDYAIEVQGRSANGQNATVQVDACWIVPCREPQVEAWIQGMAHATKVRHILESHRSGRGTNGWLETIATGVEAGRLTTSGTFLLPTGTSIVLLEFEQAADVHTFAAQVTATMTYWPRQRWEAE